MHATASGEFIRTTLASGAEPRAAGTLSTVWVSGEPCLCLQAEEEEVVIPCLLEWCRHTQVVSRWKAQNALRGLCPCPMWFCPHRRRELQLITAEQCDAEIALSVLPVVEPAAGESDVEAISH